MMATQTSPRTSHRDCPSLGRKAKSIYSNFKTWSTAYITALKNGVLRSLSDKEPSELYCGVIIYKDICGDLCRHPDLLAWGENGEWDGAFFDDDNALVCEI